MRRIEPPPHVVIIGGYLTEPLFYRPMRAPPARAGSSSGDGRAPPPGGLAGRRVRRLRAGTPAGRRAIREARCVADAPLIVVGHSAGGIVARLAMSPLPFDGRRAGVADDVGCLVMLGTPHVLRPRDPWRGHTGQRATRFLARTTPGAWFAPSTRYLTVGSTAVPPRAGGPGTGAEAAAEPDPDRVRRSHRRRRRGRHRQRRPHPPGRRAPHHAAGRPPRHVRRPVVRGRACHRPLVARRARGVAPRARGAARGRGADDRPSGGRARARVSQEPVRPRPPLRRTAAGSSRAGPPGRSS